MMLFDVRFNLCLFFSFSVVLKFNVYALRPRNGIWKVVHICGYRWLVCAL